MRSWKLWAENSGLAVIEQTPLAKLAYTVEELSELISLSRATIYRLIDLGELASIQVGRSRRVTADQVRAFLKVLEGRSQRPTVR